MNNTHHRFSRLLVLSCAVAMVVAGCSSGSGSGSSSAQRPGSAARLRIVEPTANEVTGPDPRLVLDLIDARVVPATNVKGKLRGDEGHIHVSVDGQLVSMTYGTTQDLHALKPGPHSVQAEFVATDHKPFRNRVIAAVLFQVKS